MEAIQAGTLLISDPFLNDPHFTRSVVLVCEHDETGSFGFMLNKKYDQLAGELIADLEGTDIPLFYGGPVELNTVHFLHRKPDLIEGGLPITERIFWGGDFDMAVSLLKDKILKPKDIRFFIGYSGWEKNQLNEEFETKSWIIREANEKLVFHPYYEVLWKDALADLGGEYKQMTNYPLDPQHN